MKKTDAVNLSYEQKCELLKTKIQEYVREDIVIAFSGGVDSSVLLQLSCNYAKEEGTIVYALTAQTKLHPMSDIKIAQRVAEEAGAVHKIVSVDEINEAKIENNPKDRCYRCKKTIFNKMKQLAEQLEVHYILEGTNEDDLHQYRPGIQALKELKIDSPLAECGLRKEEIRKLAEELNVSVANRPSAPCLATRLPYGKRISYDLLARVEMLEEYMRSLGFYNVRIRIHDNVARIEVDAQDMKKLLELRDGIIGKIKQAGFSYVTLDLEGFRSGSMDI